MPTISEHARRAYDDLEQNYRYVGPELVHYWRSGVANVIAEAKTHTTTGNAYYAEMMAAFNALPERINDLLAVLDDIAGTTGKAA
jgi:hypothetical protein